MPLFKALNDVTTSFENPPEFQVIAQQRPKANYSYPEKFVEIQQQLHPEIKPLLLKTDKMKIYTAIEQLIARQPNWKIATANSELAKFEVILRTALLRFYDDVVIELRTIESGQTEVHMRSKSRLGRSDLGANARRIQQFFADLAQMVE